MRGCYKAPPFELLTHPGRYSNLVSLGVLSLPFRLINFDFPPSSIQFVYWRERETRASCLSIFPRKRRLSSSGGALSTPSIVRYANLEFIFYCLKRILTDKSNSWNCPLVAHLTHSTMALHSLQAFLIMAICWRPPSRTSSLDTGL